MDIKNVCWRSGKVHFPNILKTRYITEMKNGIEQAVSMGTFVTELQILVAFKH